MMGGMGRAEDVRGTMRRLWGYLSRQKWLLIDIVVDMLGLHRAHISDRGVRWGLMWQLTSEGTE